MRLLSLIICSLMVSGQAYASTLECSGFGESLQSKKPIPLAKARITAEKLKAGQKLVLDYHGVVMFKVFHDDGTFVARFAVEDGGLPPGKQNAKSYDAFDKLNGLKSYLEFDVVDGKTGRKFWRMHAKCAVTGKGAGK